MLKQTAFRLTDEDLSILDEAKRRSGVLSRADALRFLIRYWAQRERIAIESLPAKRRVKR